MSYPFIEAAERVATMRIDNLATWVDTPTQRYLVPRRLVLTAAKTGNFGEIPRRPGRCIRRHEPINPHILRWFAPTPPSLPLPTVR